MPTPISNIDELQGMEDNVGGDYELVNDIDASDTENWNDGAGFDPVGSGGFSDQFTGSLKGNGYIITDLYINRPSENNVGLFGVTGSTVDVSELYISGTITGADYVGAVAGLGRGFIKECVAEVDVTGDNRVGGLIGWAYRPSGGSLAIVDCCARGDVTGDDEVGGLIGYQSGGTTISVEVRRCYSVGGVSGNINVGGLVGVVSGGTFEDCFWDKDASGQNNSAAGVGRSTEIMQFYYNYIGWDISPIPPPKTYPLLWFECDNLDTIWGGVGFPVHYLHSSLGHIECPIYVNVSGEPVESDVQINQGS